MRLPRLRSVRPILVMFALLSCTENGPVGPQIDPSGARLNVAGSTGPVRISEFHYDNPSTDVSEKIEISGPAGTDLTGWQIIRYNGSGGAPYTSPTGPVVGGVIPATCGARGVLVFSYPQDGLQNGSPDGFALVDNNNQVIEFLSYEGSFTAVGGPANGMISQDVGVSEKGASPEGTGAAGSPVWSLSRDAAGNWTGPAANTFGACNDNGVSDQSGVTVSPVPPATGTVAVGSTVQYQAVVKDANGVDITSTSTITWSTSPTGFATVDGNGLVTGTAAGNTSVVATAGTKSGSSALVVTAPVQIQNGDVVISQVYGGGGNSGATYTNDYIELLNKGDNAVNLAGWSVQYASASGTTYQVTNLSGTVQPGHYFLVQEAAGSGSPAALPTAEVTGTVNLSGTSGKVILAQTTTAQTTGCPTALVVDKVGYGGASCSTEWSNPATGPSNNTISVLRKGDGCIDTDVSSNDFTTGPATPRNSASPAKRCAPPVPLPAVHFSELHYDNSGTDVNEKIEIAGPAGTDLTGWSVVLYGGDAVPDFSAYSTTDIGVTIPATCGTNGVVVIDYPVNGIKNAKFNGTGNPAGMALIDNNNQVVEFLSYEGSFTALDGPAAGHVSADMGVAEEPPPAPGNSLHRDDLGVWQPAAPQDFGACNAVNATPPPATASITFTGRLATDPALPVGFEDQLFATEKNSSGVTVSSATFTWSSDTPGIATIDAAGVMHAVSAGTATFRATANDGTVATYSLQMVNNTFSNTADWSGNLEFGMPTGHAQAGDLLITHDQFTSSFNKTRNIPNWVSAKIDASHYGTGSDRCDCFTYDPIVTDSGGVSYTTDIYTGEGSVWNRGHLLRSADVESSAGDNSIAYLFTNIAPQSADMNQGPWAVEENFLGDLAKTGGKDVYVIIGASGVSPLESRLVKANVTIPGYFWKVAVIVPHGRKLADIHDYSDLQIISVVMPNINGIRNVDWNTYKVTVDSVEALSGYDLLNALPDDIEPVVESNDQVPTAVMSGPDAGVEGSSLSFSGNGSSDPDAGDVLSYSWNFGDNTTAEGINPSHTFADNGQYIVTLTVRDQIGAKNVTTKVVTINNAAPSVVVDAPAPITSGGTYSIAGGFMDAGQTDGPWSYVINWGDGSSTGTSSVQGAIGGSHQYFIAGSYTVTLTVTDKDGGVGSASTTLQVGRVAGSMSVNPNLINISNNGNGQVTVTVYGNSQFDAGAINTSSVRIGQTAVDTQGNGSPKIDISDVNHDGVLDMVAHFVRGTLVSNGDITSSSTELTLTANLNDGRQIQATGAVSVK